MAVLKPALAAATVGVVGLSGTHVQPHLVVGDVEAGQVSDPSFLRRIRSLTRSLTTARRDLKTRRRGWAGASLRDVQMLAGHRSIETTQGYIDGDSDAQRRLVALI